MQSDYVNQVPPSINFSDQILTIPTFLDLGLDPQCLISSPYITEYVAPGKWINRGDRLMTATVNFYSTAERARWNWLDAGPAPVEFYLESPCAGFVISYNSYNLPKASWGYPPVLLLPQNEPPLNHSILTAFCSSIGRNMSENWERLPVRHYNDRLLRGGEAMGETKERVIEAVASLRHFADVERRTFPVCTLDNHPDREALVREIQRFRSQDLVLRNKLVDLVKE
jgi:hypothetical protein